MTYALLLPLSVFVLFSLSLIGLWWGEVLCLGVRVYAGFMIRTCIAAKQRFSVAAELKMVAPASAGALSHWRLTTEHCCAHMFSNSSNEVSGLRE